MKIIMTLLSMLVILKQFSIFRNIIKAVSDIKRLDEEKRELRASENIVMI